MAPWYEQLRSARTELGLSRRDLAERAGLSEASVRAYELGRRHPARRHLARLLQSLHLDLRSRDRILAAAGYASEPSESDPSRGLVLAAAFIDERPWPAFVVNDRVEVVLANEFIRRLAGMPRPSQRRSVRRNALSSVTIPFLASMAVDWDEFVSGIIGVYKARNPAESWSVPSPYLAALLDTLLAGDPALLNRFMALWEATPARPSLETPWSYQTAWRYPGDHVVRFVCSVHAIEAYHGLEIHEWMPEDAESHATLEHVFAEHALTHPPPAVDDWRRIPLKPPQT